MWRLADATGIASPSNAAHFQNRLLANRASPAVQKPEQTTVEAIRIKSNEYSLPRERLCT